MIFVFPQSNKLAIRLIEKWPSLHYYVGVYLTGTRRLPCSGVRLFILHRSLNMRLVCVYYLYICYYHYYRYCLYYLIKRKRKEKKKHHCKLPPCNTCTFICTFQVILVGIWSWSFLPWEKNITSVGDSLRRSTTGLNGLFICQKWLSLRSVAATEGAGVFPC